MPSALAAELRAGPPLSAAQAGLTTFPTPPAGFNPTDASAAQLSEYGFAPRPPAGEDQAWVAAMSHWRYNLVDPVIQNLANRPGTRPQASTPENSAAPDSIGSNCGFFQLLYAGNARASAPECPLYEDEAYQPNGYYGVQAGWTVPTVTPTAKNSSSAIWPGIGGYADLDGLSNDSLVQAGTEQDYVAGSGAGYYAWYEACCTTDPDQRVISNFPVHPGDVMFVDVDLLASNAAASYSTLVTYDIINETTGEGLSIDENFSPPSGGEAEFIVENPCYTPGCHQQMLADFGTIAFTGAFWGLQMPDNPPISEYSGACIGEEDHIDPHIATQTPVPPGIPLANPEAFTDSDGCNFPVARVNPSD